MNKIEKVKDVIRQFQNKADRLFAEYQSKENWARNRYSKDAFAVEFRTNIWPKYVGRLRADTDAAIKEINDLFDEIEQDFNTWIMRPLRSETLQTLTCIKDFDLKIGLPELRVIEKSTKDSYFGSRIFSALAQKAGYQVNIVDMERCMKELQSARKNSATAVRAYAGDSPFPGRDLLGEWQYSGIVMGEFQIFHLTYAFSFLKNGGELDRLQKTWETIKAPMQYRLTPEESEKVKREIEKIVDIRGEEPKIDEVTATKLLEDMPDILNRLESMDKDYKYKELAKKYFASLDTSIMEKETKEAEINKSNISPGFIDSPRREKVDDSVLAQYK